MTTAAAVTSTVAGLPAKPAGTDPYAAYGEQVSATKVYITFKNGEYLFGSEQEEIPEGSRFIANMPGLRIGWKRWSGKRVTAEYMGLLGEGYRPPGRQELGDHDQSLWELDDRKQPRDPWQFTNEMTLRGLETGDEFVFATAGKGGIGAIGELCKAYGPVYRQKPGMAPVIELRSGSYNHKDYGKTYYPVLTLVDWVREPAAGEPPVDPPEALPAPTVPPVAAKVAEPEKPKRTRF